MGDRGRLAEQEVAHSRRLAAGQTEAAWGWETPAGRMRAQRRAALIAAGVGLKPGMCVLEIGCGTGLFTAVFAQSGATLLATDISEELLAKAKARGLPEARVRFLRGRFEEQELGGPFDAVIGSSVLHHLDLGVALARIHALLKPRGIMCFAEPNLLNPQVCLERSCRRWFPYVSPQETAFAAWRMRGDLAVAGFEEIGITPFDWLHPATPRPLIPLVQCVGRGLERVPGIRAFAGSLLIRARRPGADTPGRHARGGSASMQEGCA